jgi:hypothetical protein
MSHAAELELRQTVWAVQAWHEVGLESFERYRLWVLKKSIFLKTAEI